jgi:hypothetical protein
MSELSPWLVLIALGAFHGLNPAMGWLFAVALGLYRHSRAVVLISLLPIALGHALAIAVVVYAVVVAGIAIDEETFRILSGLLLISWGAYHLLYGHRHRLHIGLRTGHCHVNRKFAGQMTMAATVHAATVAWRQVSIA